MVTVRRTLRLRFHQKRADTMASVDCISVIDWKERKCDSTAFITFTWKIIHFFAPSIDSLWAQITTEVESESFFNWADIIFIKFSVMQQTNMVDMLSFLKKPRSMAFILLSHFADSLFVFYSEWLGFVHYLKIVFLSCSSLYPISELKIPSGYCKMEGSIKLKGCPCI